MSDAATLIVLVAAAEATDPTTHAMARATRDALGPSARVIVRETPADPGDGDAIAAERAENADAVVELSWIASREGRHRQASVRVHLRSSGRWVDRWITFRPTDADSERGRTLGFAIASILPEATGSPRTGGTSTSSTPPTASPSPSPPPAGGAAASPPAEGTPPEGSPAPAPSSPPPTTPPPPTATTPPPSPPAPTPPPRPERPEHAHQDDAPPIVTVEGVFVFDTLSGIGGGIAGDYFPLRFFSVHLGGSLRQGTTSFPDAASDTLNFEVWSIVVGAAFHPLRARLSERVGDRFGVSIRADFVFDFIHMSRPQTGPTPGVNVSPQSRWAYDYGPELGADVAFLIVPNAEAFVGGGGQVWPMPVKANEGRDRHLSWQYRAFGEAGIRLRF